MWDFEKDRFDIFYVLQRCREDLLYPFAFLLCLAVWFRSASLCERHVYRNAATILSWEAEISRSIFHHPFIF